MERPGPDSLLIIPCCASKISGGQSNLEYVEPVTYVVPQTVRQQVIGARAKALDMMMREQRYLVDNYTKNVGIVKGPDFGGQDRTGRFLPASRRYVGTLYTVPGLRDVVEMSSLQPGAPHVMILSALYGPLHPLSPIQDYNLMMGDSPARVWDAVFPIFLEAWVAALKVRHVHLFTGTTTAYFRVAKKAVDLLFARGLIESAVQYHVVNGSTRETPLQHGRKLHAMLTASPMTGGGIQDVPLGLNAASATVTAASSPAPGVPAAAPQLADFSPASASQTMMTSAPMLPIEHGQMVGSAAAPEGAGVQSHRMKMTVVSGFAADLDRFNRLLGWLSAGSMQRMALAELMTTGALPERGVYFFLDAPPAGNESEPSRVCRVGTHAVSAGSKATLRSRLRAHFGTAAGSGNHRGSIFRLHVGNALLQREGRRSETWGGSVAPPNLKASDLLQAEETELERRVSRYLGALRVLWVAVPDPTSAESERALIERNALALLSNRRRPVLRAQDDWLGHHSVQDEIRESHLWNIRYVNDDYDPRFLDVLERAVERTIAGS